MQHNTISQKISFIKNQIGLFYNGKSIWDFSSDELADILDHLIFNKRIMSTCYNIDMERPVNEASVIDVLVFVGAVLFEGFKEQDVEDLYSVINLYNNNYPNFVKVYYN